MDLLTRLHDGFGGVANLAVIERDGTPTHYAGNPENPVFTFRLDRIGLASTAIYSIDRSLFRYAAPGATKSAARASFNDRRARRGRRAASRPGGRGDGGGRPGNLRDVTGEGRVT